MILHISADMIAY